MDFQEYVAMITYTCMGEERELAVPFLDTNELTEDDIYDLIEEELLESLYVNGYTIKPMDKEK